MAEAPPVFTPCQGDFVLFDPKGYMFPPERLEIPDQNVVIFTPEIFKFPLLAIKVLRDGYLKGYGYCGNPKFENTHLGSHGVAGDMAMLQLARELWSEEMEREFQASYGNVDPILDPCGLALVDTEGFSRGDGGIRYKYEKTYRAQGQLRVTTQHPTVEKIQYLPKPVALALVARKTADKITNPHFLYELPQSYSTTEALLYYAALGLHPQDLFNFKDPTPIYSLLPQFNQLINEGCCVTGLKDFYEDLYYWFWSENFPSDEPFLGLQDLLGALDLLKGSGFDTDNLSYLDVQTYGFPQVIYREVVKPNPIRKKSQVDTRSKARDSSRRFLTDESETEGVHYFTTIPTTFFYQTFFRMTGSNGELVVLYGNKENPCAPQNCLGCPLSGHCGESRAYQVQRSSSRSRGGPQKRSRRRLTH